MKAGVRMIKVLVTGGAGFIGSHLVNRLVRLGIRVVVVDDLSTGRMSNFEAPERLMVYVRDVRDSAFMHHLLTQERFDYIYYLAAITSVVDSIKRPAATHAIDNDAVLDTLEYLRVQKLPLKQFLFTSSAVVYGDLPELPKCEDSRVAPVSPYAIDKYATERYVLAYGQLYQLPTVCVRLFNVYGPKQNPNSPYTGVLSILTHCLDTGRPFTEFGDGTQTRDFIYIEDVISALWLIHKVRTVEVINVANGEEVSLNRVIQTYERITARSVPLIRRPWRRGDIHRSVANIRRLTLLGYTPAWSLERGLAAYWHELHAGTNHPV